MVIPQAQQKSACELISIFTKVYDHMKTQLKDHPDGLAKLLNEHLETAFKLTVRSEVHFKNRAYQWLEAIVDVAPQSFWETRKRRVIKSIYTHAVDIAKINPTQF